MTDSSMNNLMHLAGRLAPSYVLSRTIDATLQLQRELQWREEDAIETPNKSNVSEKQTAILSFTHRS
ncbi:Ankyrin repeat-containing protein [Artemisia annua]|uniref:Ankyrin repeat-containing protein n=1 Tax=Artemisia annua TaxID=35608 RepID=A0A2U1L7Q7_ARTAN|nr:Ankyrin repeat-containing protein [Artemisia annua]